MLCIKKTPKPLIFILTLIALNVIAEASDKNRWFSGSGPLDFGHFQALRPRAYDSFGTSVGSVGLSQLAVAHGEYEEFISFLFNTFYCLSFGELD
jgi:hypothetical protein